MIRKFQLLTYFVVTGGLTLFLSSCSDDDEKGPSTAPAKAAAATAAADTKQAVKDAATAATPNDDFQRATDKDDLTLDQQIKQYSANTDAEKNDQIRKTMKDEQTELLAKQKVFRDKYTAWKAATGATKDNLKKEVADARDNLKKQLDDLQKKDEDVKKAQVRSTELNKRISNLKFDGNDPRVGQVEDLKKQLKILNDQLVQFQASRLKTSENAKNTLNTGLDNLEKSIKSLEQQKQFDDRINAITKTNSDMLKQLDANLGAATGDDKTKLADKIEKLKAENHKVLEEIDNVQGKTGKAWDDASSAAEEHAKALSAKLDAALKNK